MFQVLVVDDEPSAVEYICNIISMKCPELSVIQTAKNGKEGLEKFKRYLPDLIISDVKMPVMSGLDMIKAIKETGEEVSFLMVSGYQEFEYVKTAMTYGVSDYILKPMTPLGFAAAVAPVIQVMSQRIYEQRKKLVRSMIMGEAVNQDKVNRYFKAEAYYGAVIREKGLPRRFPGTYEMELISELEHTMFIYGRDEREALYICPLGAVSGENFREIIEKEKDKKKQEDNFVTAVILDGAVPVGFLKEAVAELYEELNRRLSVGVTQTISVAGGGWERSGAAEEPRREESGEDRAMPETERHAAAAGRGKSGKIVEFPEANPQKSPNEGGTDTLAGELHGREEVKQLERCLEQRDYGRLLEQLWQLLEKAERVRCPQLQLERLIGPFIARAQRYVNSRPDILEEEIMLEDAFYEAGSSQELFDSLKSILVRYWKRDKESVKLDSPEFIQEIRRYVESHLSEELTIASVCREFHLSQSYLNLIFRKHGMESFNTYVRNARIKKAKEIMDRNPQMFIKDVAAMVGYKDQFYFSRIFRAVTGMTPSGYPGRQ